MTGPLWSINSAFALMTVGAISIMFFTQVTIPPSVSIKPDPSSLSPVKDQATADITRIYKNDLFATVIEPDVITKEKKQEIPQLPPPPPEEPVAKLTVEKVEFLPPLPLLLRGTIISEQQNLNRALIVNTKTNREGIFMIGETVEDAELLFVGPSKALLVRPNGQQETLFVSPEDAFEDPVMKKPSFDDVVVAIDEVTFDVDPETFVDVVPSLAQFIDELDMTTSFNKGISTGIHIGIVMPKSIGEALGLKQNDTILSVNNIPTTSTEQRFSIYSLLKEQQEGSVITAKILRNGKEISLTYHLKAIFRDEDAEEIQEQRREFTEKIAQEESLLSPSIALNQQQDKLAMRHFGSRKAVIQRVQS